MVKAGLAIVLALGPAGIARAQPALLDSVPTITVEGMAEREVAPDLATASLGVQTIRPDAAAAARDNAAVAASLVAIARRAGLENADIRTSDLRLSPVMDGKDAGKLRGFRADNHLTLRVRDLAKLPALLGDVVAAGGNSMQELTFSVADSKPALDALRAEAVRDAAAKAQLYAKAAGVSLGRVLRIAPEGEAMPVSPAPRFAKLQATAAEAPPPPVEPGTQMLSARLSMTWELIP